MSPLRGLMSSCSLSYPSYPPSLPAHLLIHSPSIPPKLTCQICLQWPTQQHESWQSRPPVCNMADNLYCTTHIGTSPAELLHTPPTVITSSIYIMYKIYVYMYILYTEGNQSLRVHALLTPSTVL